MTLPVGIPHPPRTARTHACLVDIDFPDKSSVMVQTWWNGEGFTIEVEHDTQDTRRIDLTWTEYSAVKLAVRDIREKEQADRQPADVTIEDLQSQLVAACCTINAMNEIERLRAECQRTLDQGALWEGRFREAEQEVERLRAERDEARKAAHEILYAHWHPQEYRLACRKRWPWLEDKA